MKTSICHRHRSPIAILVCTILSIGIITGCAQKVCPADFRTHIQILAGDALGGRGIGTNGIDLAAGYIAGQFASAGIEPGGPDGSYFQEFEVTTGNKLGDDHEFTLTGVDAAPARDTDYIPFSFSNNDTFDGDVVFTGYGIVNQDKDHDDYANLDVTDKIVLMLRREPPAWGDDGEYTNHATFRSKIYGAKEKGAAAVLIVNRIEQDADQDLMRFRSGRMGGMGGFGLPAFHVKQELAETMLRAGGLEELQTLQNKLDNGSFASAPLSGVRLAGHTGVETTVARARNVIGLIRGEGTLAHEHIVIGGHYDHLGESVPMSMFRRPDSPGEAQIHNGADDNASGTAGVIEIGRLLAARKPLKRSVVLMAFTGEETGLLGSKHYADNPTVPIENIVAMLNMDMIGRLDDQGTIQIFGTKAADEFEEMIVRLTKRSGLNLRANESALGPSDHTSFYRKKIPALHFFTGLHSDYHQPGDDTEKVNHDGGARVSDLVLAVADEIIRSEARPTYNEVKSRASIGRGPRLSRGRPRVRMGIMPGYVDEGKGHGLMVDGVAEGGPAADAGVKDGDSIIKIGLTEIDNIQDYMAALRNNKPGDVVDIVVLRDGKEITLPVKLTR